MMGEVLKYCVMALAITTTAIIIVALVSATVSTIRGRNK